MQRVLNVFVVGALCLFGAVGCGGTLEEQTEGDISSTQQGLNACLGDGTQSGACPSGYSCVSGACRVQCSSTGTCGTGQKCCLGYVYPDGSVMYPYCISSTSVCWLPPQ